MDDLHIWAQLLPRDPGDEALYGGEQPPPRSSDELCSALTQLHDRALKQRAPFLGLVAPLCSHSDAAVRAAAIRVLAGAQGIEGLRAIVAALDDPEQAVRRAAGEALVAGARGEHGWRLLHALFHPRADVRAAVFEELPSELAWVRVYLRMDPACSARAPSRSPWARAWSSTSTCAGWPTRASCAARWPSTMPGPSCRSCATGPVGLDSSSSSR